MNFLFQGIQPPAVLAAEFGKSSRIDLDAVMLQFHQHVDQGKFDLGEELRKFGFFEFFGKNRLQPERDEGVFGGVIGDLPQGHFLHPFLMFAAAD